MKQKPQLRVQVATMLAILALATFIVGVKTAGGTPLSYTATSTPETVEPPKPTLTHSQEVWLHSLEWCESRGNPAAINKMDRDGTPSYGAFQFKPSTLDYYADMYGVATTTLMDYETQRAVVEQMILHRGEINWSQQFPDCVKRLGSPPEK